MCKAGAVIENEENVSVYFVLADNDEVSSVVLPHFETNNKPFSLIIILISKFCLQDGQTSVPMSLL